MNSTPLILISSLLGSTLLAQENPTGQPGARTPATQNPQGQSNAPGQNGMAAQQEGDQVLISWLLVDNENEIALARIAVQRAENPQVKQFAQTMIDDHQKMVDALRQATGNTSGSATDGRRDATTGGRSSTGTPTGGQQPGDRTSEASGGETRKATDASSVRTDGGFDHRRLITDLGAKCRQSATEMLQQKQGAEFDRCYMGMQVGVHMKAQDTLEVFRGYASPTLRSSLEQSLTTVKQHKQQAEQIAKQLEKEGKVAKNDGR